MEEDDNPLNHMPINVKIRNLKKKRDERIHHEKKTFKEIK